MTIVNESDDNRGLGTYFFSYGIHPWQASLREENFLTFEEKITNKKYDYSDTKEAVAFRVIADHIRAIAFTIADGQLPANTGAGYVIRRILRRAVRYYYSYLDYKHPLLHQLMPSLAKQFENVFPELTGQLEFVTKVVKEEEEGFLRTLEKGLKRMDDIISTHPKMRPLKEN